MSLSFARARRAAAFLVLALLGSSCSLDTDEGGPVLYQNFVPGTGDAPPAGSGTEVTVTNASQRGIIHVAGLIAPICGRGLLDVDWDLNQTEATFRITHQPSSGCTGTVDERVLVQYFIYLTRVPAGTYQVKVFHENDTLVEGTGAVQVHQQEVRVLE